MSFNRSADVLQRAGGGRFNVPVADDEFCDQSRPQEMRAEYGLVEAVLREAIREYQKFAGQQGRRGSRLFREVHEWFLEDDRKWDFSFINVCQILDLEPTYIRTGLKMWCDRNVRTNAAQDLRKMRTRRTHRRRVSPAPMIAETAASR
jgi:hypothetical protein